MPRVAALLLGGAFLSAVAATQPSAMPDTTQSEPVRFLDTVQHNPHGLNEAVKGFVLGMAEGDAAAVWQSATEEEQDAFQTEPAALKAISDDFPALTRTREATLVRRWQEGDDTFVSLLLRDRAAHLYQADMGLWRDDAGDWRIVSLDVRNASDLTASR